MHRQILYLTIAVITVVIAVNLSLTSVVKNEQWFLKTPNFEAKKQDGKLSQIREVPYQKDGEIISPELPALEFNELKVKDVKLGDSEVFVLKKLGKPLSNKRTGDFACGNAEKTLRYSGLVVKVEKDNEGKNYNVVSIKISSSKWQLSGVSVGADVKEIHAKFKNRHHWTMEDSGVKGLHYPNGDGGASFWFQDNKLVSIDWEYNWC